MSYSQITIALALIAAPGCAGRTLPEQQLMDTQGAITSAEELKGDEDPTAKLHLQYAREQLATAKKQIEDGDRDEAKRTLDRASADAELALTLARTEKVHKESLAARAEVDALASGKGTAATADIVE
jgi:hypothetical protein